MDPNLFSDWPSVPEQSWGVPEDSWGAPEDSWGVDEDSWEALLAELVQVQHQKMDYTSYAYLHEHEWTVESVAAETERFGARQYLLNRLQSLHRKDKPKLEIAKHRANNAILPISRLPDDVLLAIFHAFVVHLDADPVVLAKVCYRWMSIVLGDLGVSIWACIRLDNAIRQWTGESVRRRINHFLRRSKAHVLYLILPGAMHADIDRSLRQASSRWRVVEKQMDIHPSRFLPLEADLSQLVAISLLAPLGKEIPASVRLGDPVLIHSCPSLTSARLRLDDVRLSHHLRSLASYAKLTHLTVHVVARGSTAIYQALKRMETLEYLSWSDSVTPSAPPPTELINLPNLRTLVLFHTAAIVTFPSFIDAPGLRRLHMVFIPSVQPFVPAPGQWFPNEALLRPDLYHQRTPELETVWYTNANILPGLLFQLLARHPRLREIHWESSFGRVEQVLSAISSVLVPNAPDHASSSRPLPFLTFGCQSSPRLSDLDAIDATAVSGTPSKKIRTTSNLSEKQFGDALHGRLGPLLHAMASPPSSFTSLFRLGIHARLARSSELLSDLIEEWPGALLKRPYSIEWAFANR